MFTIEQKVNLVLRYIASTDDTQRLALKTRIIEALKDGASTNPTTDIDDMIADLLKEVGVPAHLIGHGYLICAIKLVVDDRTYLRQITDRLYPDVATKCDTTASRTERAIRHAIEVVFDRCDYEILYNLFGNTISFRKGKLTNSEFIVTCANEISRRMKMLDVEVA